VGQNIFFLHKNKKQMINYTIKALFKSPPFAPASMIADVLLFFPGFGAES
jgi:hypothetical protein